jgi:octaprenyl-diphosphate synthase
MNHPATATATSPAPRDLTGLRTLVASDLECVNQIIIEQSTSDIALISQVASHIIAAGGKRLRPCLTLASAKLCGYEGDRHVRLAACVEFIHTATLLHDDVVDESTLRRGEQTANAVWGNQSSVLVGDFLLSRAFQLMVADGSLDVLKILSDAAATISAGEVQQLMVSHDIAITAATYEEIIGAKTAVLFSAACELGAVITNQPALREALRQFGHALGMAFQLADDALDYATSDATLGKAIGDDFREGKVTLPVILAYAAGNEAERSFWESALESTAAFTPEMLNHARSLLLKHGSIAQSLQRAQYYKEQALSALKSFPASPAKHALQDAAAFAVDRAY